MQQKHLISVFHFQGHIPGNVVQCLAAVRRIPTRGSAHFGFHLTINVALSAKTLARRRYQEYSNQTQSPKTASFVRRVCGFEGQMQQGASEMWEMYCR